MAEQKAASTGTTITRVFDFRPESVIPACPTCQAQGVYHSLRSDPSASIFHKWPGVWVQPLDDRAGSPVGEICPHCGGARTEKVSVDEWRATHPVD